MPTLPQYTAPGDTGYQIAYHSGGKPAQADEFAPDTSGLSKGLSQADATISQAESRKALVGATEIRANYAQQLDAAAESGADTGKIKEQMNADLSRLGDSMNTQTGAYEVRLHTASSNMMFDHQANSIAVHQAGIQAKVEAGKFLTGTAALLNSRPDYLPIAEGDADKFASTLAHTSPAQREEIAQKLKSELNLTAAIGSGRLDPNGTLAKLQNGDWTLTPEQRMHATNEAEKQIRGLRADEDHARALKEYNEREADEGARGEWLNKIITGPGHGEDLAKGILADSRLKPTTQEHMINYMELRTREMAGQEKKSDEETKRNLWMAINAPKGDPRKIYNSDTVFKAAEAGLLNTKDADYLNTQVANQKNDDGAKFATRLQARISAMDGYMRASPVYSAQPDLAAAMHNQMISDVEKQSDDMRKANKDPADLLNPDSKAYYFTPNRLKQVEQDVKQQQAAAGPKLTDLRQTPSADIPVGQPFVNSKGQTVTMTQEAFDARKKAAAPTTNLIRSTDEKKVDQLYGPQRGIQQIEETVVPSSSAPASPDVVVKGVKQQDVPAPKELPPAKIDSNNEFAWLFPDSMQSVPKAEKARIQKEFDHFKSIAQNGKTSEAERDEALRQMVLRAAKLGLSRRDIERAIGKPLHKLNLQAPQ